MILPFTDAYCSYSFAVSEILICHSPFCLMDSPKRRLPDSSFYILQNGDINPVKTNNKSPFRTLHLSICRFVEFNEPFAVLSYEFAKTAIASPKRQLINHSPFCLMNSPKRRLLRQNGDCLQTFPQNGGNILKMAIGLDHLPKRHYNIAKT
jgi:hypothetical protein